MTYSVAHLQAAVKVDFVVVGAGLAGLSCAYALGRSGHRVRVLEAAPSLNQNAGAIISPPNLTKLLEKWGHGDAYKKISTICHCAVSIDLQTDEHLGVSEWREDVMREMGADFVVVHHNDLLRLLYKISIELGVDVRFGARVKSVDPSTPSVTLTTGEVIKGDVIVGADGYHSLVREVVMGYKPDYQPMGVSIYSMTLPAKSAQDYPEVLKLFEDPYLHMMADGTCMIAHGVPRAGKREMTIQFFGPDGSSKIDGYFSPNLSIQKMIDKVNFSPRFRKLIELPKSSTRTTCVLYEQPEDWVHEDGKVVLIGQAAHPMLPATVQHAAMAIEDGAVLGGIFKYIKSRETMSSFLYAYEEIRQDRTKFMGNTQLGSIQVAMLPHGPSRDARNKGLASVWSDNPDGDEAVAIRQLFEQFCIDFSYDAYDAADTWWVEWGSLRERADSLLLEQEQSD